ncbi:MAG TPA: M1 family aminopeptidase [Edaphobacter sp.]|nr:M1 family aminopeptidase [Edaphobacter sp.]
MAVAVAVRRFFVVASIYVFSSLAMAQATPPPEETTPPHGKVLFNRNQEDPNSPAADKTPKAETPEPAVTVTDAERSSITFTAYDLDVHLTPAKSHVAVHAEFTVKNSGNQPLSKIALQISSSLHWETFAIRSDSRTSQLPFAAQTVDTDADHTGKATEAVLTLQEPLQPGASLELSSLYSGEIVQSAERLERIGAPLDQAAHADWDKISPEGTALRGFGNVLWYPVAAAPVFLGDGAKLFQSVGEAKLQQAGATIHLRLAIEYTGDAPDAAFFCGRREQLKAVSENENVPVAESPGLATADFSRRLLGFRTPSLFVTDRAGTVADGSLISAVTSHYDALPSYGAAAAKVQPLLTEWLGPGPLSMLNILDLNLLGGAGQPFEDDSLLVTPMRASTADVLAPSLVHSLSHAWFASSHVWLDEGVAELISLLWMEQGQGREVTVEHLQDQAKALALIEPMAVRNAPVGEGQSLIAAHDEVYYRTKATAVLWMLRSLVGDEALQHALQTYRTDKLDSDPKEFQRVLEQSAKRDLGWFFDDWVYSDKGLPDLTIASVTPRALDQIGDKGSGWLVAVEVRNDGGAVADVPVTVRSGTLTVTQRLRIPALSSASTRIVFEGTPDEVLVNDGSVPEISSSRHTRQIVAR